MTVIDKSQICVLIPAYNEEKKITGVVSGVLSRGYAVVVVDDGSTDSTAEKIRSLPVACVVSPKNEGKGAAIQRGFDWFAGQPYLAMVIMDADGQHRPEELENFVLTLEKGEADIVVGNRMFDRKGMSWVRVVTNRFMSFIISAIARQKIPDTQCGFRALTKDAAAKIRLKTKRFEVESEMLLLASKAGLKIRSIPIESVYRDEVSHIHPGRDTVRFLSFLIKFLLTQILQ